MPAKYWCDLCKVFVVDTRLGRKDHEASAKHKYARERQINDLQRSARIKEKEAQQVSRLLSGIDRDLGIQSSSVTTVKTTKPTKTTTKTTASKADYRPPGTVSPKASEPVQAVLGAGVAGEWVSVESTKSQEQPQEPDAKAEKADEKPEKRQVSMHSTSASGHKRKAFNHPEDNWKVSKKTYKAPVDLAKLEQLVSNDAPTEPEAPKPKSGLFKKRKKGMSK